jgi:hypothetical protein
MSSGKYRETRQSVGALVAKELEYCTPRDLVLSRPIFVFDSLYIADKIGSVNKNQHSQLFNSRFPASSLTSSQTPSLEC